MDGWTTYALRRPTDTHAHAHTQCKKGTTIAKFLELVKAQVAAEFTELRAISADDLMYIKEDLIIPHVRTSVCVCVLI